MSSDGCENEESIRIPEKKETQNFLLLYCGYWYSSEETGKNGVSFEHDNTVAVDKGNQNSRIHEEWYEI